MKTQVQPKTASAKKTGDTSTSVIAKTAPVQKAGVNAGKSSTTSARKPAQKGDIAVMAYKIWQEQGCPEGREEQHWRQAEQAVGCDESCACTH